MYAPKMGRFLQRDPIEYLDELNTYQYASLAPTKLTDPYGTEARIAQREIAPKDQGIPTGFTDPRRWSIVIICECYNGKLSVKAESGYSIYVSISPLAEFERRVKTANPRLDAAAVKATAEIQRDAVIDEESGNAKTLKQAWDKAEKKFLPQIQQLGTPSFSTMETWETKVNGIVDKWVEEWARGLWSRYAADRSRIRARGGVAPDMPAESFEAYTTILRDRVGQIKCKTADIIAGNA